MDRELLPPPGSGGSEASERSLGERREERVARREGRAELLQLEGKIRSAGVRELRERLIVGQRPLRRSGAGLEGLEEAGEADERAVLLVGMTGRQDDVRGERSVTLCNDAPMDGDLASMAETIGSQVATAAGGSENRTGDGRDDFKTKD